MMRFDHLYETWIENLRFDVFHTVMLCATTDEQIRMQIDQNRFPNTNLGNLTTKYFESSHTGYLTWAMLDRQVLLF